MLGSESEEAAGTLTSDRFRGDWVDVVVIKRHQAEM